MPTKSNPPPVTTNGALKLREARAYLGNISTPTVHRLIQRGLLRPNRSTRHLLFTRAELDRFLTAGMT
jgi:excisionase family DNA binding protein